MRIKKIIISVCTAFFISMTGLGISAEENSYTSETDTFYGDINGDMKISAADYVAFMKYFTGRLILLDSALKKADMDKNGEINIADAVLLKSMSIDKI